MKVGFIGLRMMGSGISANLQKAGHAMVVHDARRAAADKIVAAGAEWAASPKAVAEVARVEEAAGARHLPTIPETPIRRHGRPVKKTPAVESI